MSDEPGFIRLANYRQLHVDPEMTRVAAAAAGLPPADFDGVAMTRSIDIAAHTAAISGAAASSGMGDNATFIDVGRSPYLTLWELQAWTERLVVRTSLERKTGFEPATLTLAR